MKELKLPEDLDDVSGLGTSASSVHPSIRPRPDSQHSVPRAVAPSIVFQDDLSQSESSAPLPPGIDEAELISDRLTDNIAELARQSRGPLQDIPTSPQAAPGFILLQNEDAGSFFNTFRVCLQALKEVDSRQVWREFDLLGLRSLPFICLVLSCVGAILVYQAGVQALRLVPDTSQIGPAYLELLVRDLAATLTGLMLAARVGAGIAAEIGSMKATDQLDALRLSQADPIVYLVAPKLLASFFFTPLLTLIAGTCALGAGAITGLVTFEIRPATFWDPRFLAWSSLGIGLCKALTFGLVIPLFSAHAGLYCRRGSQGVGDATTRAVVNSSLGVIIFGFIWGILGHGFFR